MHSHCHTREQVGARGRPRSSSSGALELICVVVVVVVAGALAKQVAKESAADDSGRPADTIVSRTPDHFRVGRRGNGATRVLP